MECIYTPELTENSRIISPDNDESRHLRALRLRAGDKILCTNGKGLSAECELLSFSPYEVKPVKFLKEYGEATKNITIAAGLLDARDRFEFLVEKATELGAARIIPLHSQRVQRPKADPKRLHAKAVAAMKQCRRSRLPEISPIMTFKGLSKQFSEFDMIIFGDAGGIRPEIPAATNILLMAGPEGGFSPEEKEIIKGSGAVGWNLGNRRLRGETACIALMSLFSALT